MVWLGSSAVETEGLWIGATSLAMSFGLRLLPDGRSVPRCPTMAKFAEADNGWYRSTLGDLLSSFIKRRLKLRPSSMALGLDQVPESLLPLLLLKEPLGLTWPGILRTVVLFFVLELVLSRLLFWLRIRKTPY